MKSLWLLFIAVNLVIPAAVGQENDEFIYNPPGSVVSSETSATNIMTDISNWLIGFIASIAVLFVIIGAIQYAMALGDQEKIKTAKRTLLWAALGIVLALLSYVIVPQIAALVQ